MPRHFPRWSVNREHTGGWVRSLASGNGSADGTSATSPIKRKPTVRVHPSQRRELHRHLPIPGSGGQQDRWRRHPARQPAAQCGVAGSRDHGGPLLLGLVLSPRVVPVPRSVPSIGLGGLSARPDSPAHRRVRSGLLRARARGLFGSRAAGRSDRYPLPRCVCRSGAARLRSVSRQGANVGDALGHPVRSVTNLSGGLEADLGVHVGRKIDLIFKCHCASILLRRSNA